MAQKNRLGLTEQGMKAIARLGSPRHTDDLVAHGLSDEVIALMQDQGLLEEQDETQPPTVAKSIYVSWKGQRGMLIDHTRTRAFDAAIRAVVKPGDKVIDVGTGTGILAMMAARAGAAKSWGLEVTGIAEWAAKLAKANGLDAVEIVRGDAGRFSEDHQADVVMGEFQGMFFLEEWQHYAAFAKVRDKHLKPGGKVIPAGVSLKLAAIDDRKLYRDRGYGFWEDPVYGFDYSIVRDDDIANPRRYITSVDARSIVEEQVAAVFDFSSGNEQDYLFTSDLTYHYGGAGNFHGLIGYFDIHLAPGHLLSTSPFTKETHWHQSYFAIPVIQVPAGGEVNVRVRTFFNEVEQFCMGLTVAGPGEALDDGTERPEHVYILE